MMELKVIDGNGLASETVSACSATNSVGSLVASS